MNGKFLQEENAAEENPETEILRTEEKASAGQSSPGDVFALPESRKKVIGISDAADDAAGFRESGDDVDAAALPENQQDYTVAPVQAVIPLASPVQSKTEAYQETTDENLRRTGLAWSAATVLIGSVVFMLIIGWFFDLVFGSSPWGIVVGIILGAIIGFVQFFRMTSQIFKKDDNNSLGFK